MLEIFTELLFMLLTVLTTMLTLTVILHGIEERPVYWQKELRKAGLYSLIVTGVGVVFSGVSGIEPEVFMELLLIVAGGLYLTKFQRTKTTAEIVLPLTFYTAGSVFFGSLMVDNIQLLFDIHIGELLQAHVGQSSPQFVIALVNFLLFMYLASFRKLPYAGVLLRFDEKLVNVIGGAYLVAVAFLSQTLWPMRQVWVQNNNDACVWLTILLMVLILTRGEALVKIEERQQHQQTEQLLQQQAQYVQHLEELQQELRGIQHDHKNLITAMYLDVKQGNLANIETYMDQHLRQVDASLEQAIKEQNQLTQIRVPEVKSLLLTKLIHAEELQLKVSLEVPQVIHQLPIPLTDFLRLLGILLDNAIEASQESVGKELQLLFWQKEQELHVVIENHFSEAVDQRQIWHPGYSSKGEDRGLGLANLRKIIGNYPQVLTETKIQGDWFTQILRFR